MTSRPIAAAPLLALFTFLFFFRVAGQAMVVFFPVDWLPADEAWASGLIPYPALLAIQLLMLVVMARIVAEVRRGGGFFATPRASWARFLIRLSAVYAGAMALRYMLTMFLRPDMRWLGGTIPIFFHFVLAAFLYTWGRLHARAAIFASPDRAC